MPDIELAALDITDNQRQRFVKAGVTLPGSGGAYPIPTVAYLRRAIQSFGRVRPDDRQKLISHIKDRADALNADKLPWVANFLAKHGGDSDDAPPKDAPKASGTRFAS
jgi:hypothetical protein